MIKDFRTYVWSEACDFADSSKKRSLHTGQLTASSMIEKSVLGSGNIIGQLCLFYQSSGQVCPVPAYRQLLSFEHSETRTRWRMHGFVLALKSRIRNLASSLICSCLTSFVLRLISEWTQSYSNRNETIECRVKPYRTLRWVLPEENA